MRTKVSRILGTLFLLCCCTTAAHANSYPPPNPGVLPNGNPPGCQSPDTLIRIENIQNPALPSASCHPVPPDTVYGVAGIITGFDPIPTGFAIYVQNSDGNPWGGIDLFTGGTNYQTLFTPNLALGDSISFSGRMDEFGGGGEIRGFANSAFNPPLPAVRRLSTGNPLPPFKRGTVNLLNELNSNPNAEQWEGCLVRVSSDAHKLRVVRSSDQNSGLGTPNSFLVVDHVLCPTNAVGPCDSLFIDGNTLAVVGPPAIGALVDSVQGIYDQRARGYRIQLRSGNDLFDTSPPSLLDAFPIANGDSIRVVFDRDLTLASAQNTLNYTLTSTGFPPDGAKQQVDKRVVHLKITNGLANGDPEGVTVNGVVNANNGQAMTSAGTRNFFNGVMPIATVQAPDAVSLGGAPCSDRSKFAGAGNQLSGGRMSTRGVCIAAIGSTFWIETAAGGARSGIAVFAPSAPLTVGRQYLIAGATQEFFTETELAGTVYVKDEGVVAIPAATVKPISVLRDTTCDPTQSLDTGEDYEGMLVQVTNVKTVDERTAGQNFFVAGPYPSNPDTILIDSDAPRTFDPTKNQYVTVVGVEDVSFEVVGTTFRIQPRNNADITVNTTLGVDPTVPAGVSFSIAPNVGRASQITFAVPKADHVFIGVYDIAGRQRAVLVDREYPAGTWHVDWNGRDGDGHVLGSGVYFYKLKVNGQTLNQRSVVLN